MNFNRDHLDVGCTGRVSFTIPPFSYELGVIELKKNEYIKFESDGKYFGGTAEMKFYEKNGHLHYEEPHRLYARNNFIYWYYKKLLADNHVPYMESRFKKLEKVLTKSNKSCYC
ncbi:MAG TPA: hypothetical protein VK071_08335 [Tissierellales bacterium]|nr:hypothetical protein [Tissierellales bacterium]